MTAQNQIFSLGSGHTQINVWSLGARLNDVSWNGFEGLCDGSTTIDEAVGPKLNHGSVIGPVANRIAGASFQLEDHSYSFPPNEGDDTLLHSGDRSLRDRTWDIVATDVATAVLATEVADMEDGFSGNRRFEAAYAVHADGFDLRLSATTDAPTLVNLALHPYWRLDAGSRNGLRLGVNADCYLPIDSKKIPTGEILPVDGTIFDLRTARIPSTEIDHNFCLSPDSESSACLVSDRMQLDIHSDAPGLQVYAGSEIGIALEPQHWPDAPHHGNFPSIRLDPGETYTQMTRYRLKAL